MDEDRSAQTDRQQMVGEGKKIQQSTDHGMKNRRLEWLDSHMQTNIKLPRPIL